MHRQGEVGEGCQVAQLVPAARAVWLQAKPGERPCQPAGQRPRAGRQNWQAAPALEETRAALGVRCAGGSLLQAPLRVDRLKPQTSKHTCQARAGSKRAE